MQRIPNAVAGRDADRHGLLLPARSACRPPYPVEYTATGSFQPRFGPVHDEITDVLCRVVAASRDYEKKEPYMAYATYEHDGHRRVGLVQAAPGGDRLIPLHGLTELGVDTTEERLKSAKPLTAQAVPVAEVRLCPVVPNPDKIICVGLNYRTHVDETGRDLPTYPVLFTKFASALIGANDDIIAPPESAAIDYEAELAVVIGRAGRRIAPERALEHVLGYTVANDISMRDYQAKTHQWLQGKTWERSTPLGPYLTTSSEVDVSAVGIRTIKDGVKLQDANTADLIFDVPRLIATISEFTTLLPGDVILTGTPGGVGFKRQPPVLLTDGDSVTVEIDGVGSLTNTLRREPDSGENAP